MKSGGVGGGKVGQRFQPVGAGIFPAWLAMMPCNFLSVIRGLEARADRLEACPTTSPSPSTSEFGFKTPPGLLPDGNGMLDSSG